MAKKPTKDTGAEKAEGIALDFGGEPPAQAAPEAPQGEQAQAPLTILGQYTRDLSFEAPGAPQIFGELENNPSIEISVDVQTRHLGDQAHECSLHFTVNGTFNGKPGFVLELVYGAACSGCSPPKSSAMPSAFSAPVSLVGFLAMIFSSPS